MIFEKLYVKWLVYRNKAVDIWSRSPYPGGVLSNIRDHSFVFDGIECRSMESFLQSLKVKSMHDQIVKCGLPGIKAKMASGTNWKQTQCLYWKGKTIERRSIEYQLLLRKAYKAMFTQNEEFRDALLATVGMKLFHLGGKRNSYETVLTRREFCRILTELRDGMPWGHKAVSGEYKACTRKHCPFRCMG